MSRASATSAEGFSYNQLSDAAKQKAREWWSSLACTDDGWWENVYTDAIAAFAYLGFEVSAEDMRFSGFAFQGVGASFGGSFGPTEKSAVEAIKEYAPQDKVLLALAERVDVLHTTARLKWNVDGWACRIYRYSYSCHSGSMRSEAPYLAGHDDAANPTDDEFFDADEEMLTIARAAADWLYRQLEAEHDYLTSDESAKEALEGGIYRFDEDGHII